MTQTSPPSESSSRNGRPQETPLRGGVANSGAVMRVQDQRFGDSVRRPSRTHTAEIHAFLNHLRRNGVPEAVEPLGIDDLGREVVRFVESDPSTGAVPAWDFPPVEPDHSILRSIANVQRRMHEAAATFNADPTTEWGSDHYFSPGSSGMLVCHNDLCISNVLRRDGTVVAIIDFDYARPVNPLFDIAVALRHWLPILAREDCPEEMCDLDRPGRFGAYCDELLLTAAERSEVLDLARCFLLHAKGNVARLAAAGIGGFAAMMSNGYAERNDRTVGWLSAERSTLLTTAV